MDGLPSECLDEVRALCYDQLRNAAPMIDFAGMANLNRSGILHLDHDQMSMVGNMLQTILKEQHNPSADSRHMTRRLLQMALAYLNRIRSEQYPASNQRESWKRQMIVETLRRFESQLDASWDIAEIAGEYRISAGYFRSVFKEVTGLPPKQYLNRMRIVRAIELIQGNRMSMYEVAQAIGIDDQNYFSRLCRSVTGFPPSHFREK